MPNDTPQNKPKRMTLRDQQKATTRERLLDAAIEVFGEHGFRNATVDQIANAAGAYRATFYLHFKDKSEVAAGLARRLTPDVQAAFARLCAMKAPSVATLEKWVKEYVQNANKSTILVRMLEEAMAGDDAFVQEYQVFIDYLADKVMAEAFLRIPAQRRALVRTRFVLLYLMLVAFLRMNKDVDTPYPGRAAYRTIAEAWKTQFFDEQTAAG
jgi:AcrR family transcriptional regulator